MVEKTPKNDPAPLVSIVCLTFNHEKYIAQTIEGFIFQRADFPFEIIIHDDASTDGTLKIIREYQVRYPDLINVIAQPENLYSKGVRVFSLALSYAKGIFIAYCEGDDYWVDPDKIQKQANFLLNNPRYGLVFTNSNIFYESKNKLVIGHDRSNLKNISIDEAKKKLLIANPYTTCTSMFRKKAVAGYQDIARKLNSKMDDLPLWLYILDKYKIGLLSDITATYRIRSISASHFLKLSDAVRFQKSRYKVSIYFNRQFGNIIDKNRLKDSYREAVLEFCLMNDYYIDSLRYAKSFAKHVSLFSRALIRPIYIWIASSSLYKSAFLFYKKS